MGLEPLAPGVGADDDEDLVDDDLEEEEEESELEAVAA